MISWVFPEEYPLGCWEMQQNPIRGESEAGELAAIKDWFPGCLSLCRWKKRKFGEKGACDLSRWESRKYRKMNEYALANFALEELAQMAKFKVGPSWACVDDETRDSYFPLLFYVSACFSFSKSVKSPASFAFSRKRLKPRLIVAASVGLVVWVDGDFATLSCFWGDAHENEVVQKNCMKFWDGRTAWQCHHAIIEALLVGPLEGEGHIPRVYLDTFWEIISRSQVWTLAHEMICCLTNLIETSPCWIKLDSTIIKTSLIQCAYCSERERERSDVCLKLRFMLFVLFWHHLAGMFLSFIISTQCQRLNNGEDSSKHVHCPMLRPRPVWWWACLRFSRECAVCWDSLLTSC